MGLFAIRHEFPIITKILEMTSTVILLESLIGAIFIDQGLLPKPKIILSKKLSTLYIDMNKLDSLVLSHKAFLIEWGQKQKKELQFITKEEGGTAPKITYNAKIYLQNELLAKAKATSKKKAEEKAAKIATRILKLNPKPIHS